MRLFKRVYDREYHEDVFYREAEDSQRNRKRLELLRDYIPGGRLLEIGCGTGGFLRQAERYFQVEGMDVSQYAVKRASEHFGKRVKVGNIEERSLERENYDTVAAFNVLEHLRSPLEAVAHMWAALKDGGWLIGSVPNKQGLIGRPLTAAGNFFDRTHVSTLSPSAWLGVFYSCGFREIHFLGEINFGRNLCWYLAGPNWGKVAFNLMFVCRK